MLIGTAFIPKFSAQPPLSKFTYNKELHYFSSLLHQI